MNASGTIPAGGAPLAANYVLDGVQTLSGSIPAASQDEIHQTLFRSPVLEDGFHNLTVQVIQTGQGRNYTFQQFNVSNTPASDTSSGPSHSITDVNGSSTPGPQGGSPSPDPQDGSTGETRKAASAAIVGGVLGVIIFLLVAALAVVFIRKNAAIRRLRSEMEESGNGELHILKNTSLVTRDQIFS